MSIEGSSALKAVRQHVTVRKTVRQSLARIREFWEAHSVWPESTPQDDGVSVEYEGPRPADLEQAACTECGTNVWRTRRGPYVAEYDTGAICGYCSYECYFSIFESEPPATRSEDFRR